MASTKISALPAATAIAAADLFTIVQGGVNKKAAGTIPWTLTGLLSVNDIALPTTTSGTVGTVLQNGSVIFSTYGTDNLFLGKSSGNFTTTGAGQNVAVGFGTLTSLSSGVWNTAVGYASGDSITSGSSNASFGLFTLFSNTTGSNNSAFGAFALQSGGGSRNTALGDAASYLGTAFNDVTAIGYIALAATTASENTAVGSYSFPVNTSGVGNVGVGFQSGMANITGAAATFIGYQAGKASTADHNTALGYTALTATTSGAQNTALGSLALATNITGSANVAIGYQALTANTGSTNTAVGVASLAANSSGSKNSALGVSALAGVQTGTDNAAFGYQALTVATGSNNTAVGSSASAAITTGLYNTALGYGALGTITTGQGNIGLGMYASAGAAVGSSNTLFIGDTVIHSSNWAIDTITIASSVATGPTMTNKWAISAASAASASAQTLTGAWFTGGSATTTKPHVLIQPTGTTSTGWNTAGTGLGVNAASGFTGYLTDFQLNGASVFSVDSTGVTRVTHAVGLSYEATNTAASSASAGAFSRVGSDDGAALASGDRLGLYVFCGSFDTSHVLTNTGALSAYTTEAWTGSAKGTKVAIEVTPNGSTTRAIAFAVNHDSAASIGLIGTSFPGNTIAGVQTAAAAVSGQVGEVISANVSTYTNYTTTATFQQITTVTLTPGDWLITGFLTVAGNGATVTSTANYQGAISTTTASSAGTTEGLGDLGYIAESGVNATSGKASLVVFSVVNISASTAYYLNSRANFTAGNPQFVGSLSARRLR